MFKTVTILLIALFVGCIGHAYLRSGMKTISDTMGEFSFSQPRLWGPFFLMVITSPKIIFGVFLQTIFFVLWLVALSRAELSFVLPFSAMEYLFAAIIAYLYLSEEISWMRVSGTFVVCLGVLLICVDQMQKTANGRVL